MYTCMKKVLLAVLSAALLAAVILSAGCISTDTETADPVSGVWVTGDDEGVCVYIFDDDEPIGIFYSTYADETYAEDGVAFLWENEGNGVYTLTYLDGDIERCVLDAEKGTLTAADDNTVLVNLADALRGEIEDAIVGVWAAKNKFGSYLFVFNDDNTCVYYSTYKKEMAEGGVEFSWKNNGNGTYTLSSADGRDYPVVLDIKEVTLTTYDNAVFRQVTIDNVLEGENAVSGVWVAKDSKGSYLAVFEDDKTGVYYSTNPTEKAENGVAFTWKKGENGLYNLSYEDGWKGSWVLDAKAGTFTTTGDNTVFIKVTFKDVISTENDAVTGLWGLEDKDGYCLYIFNEDGTGEYHSTYLKEKSLGGSPFLWINEGDGVYHLEYDGEEEHCVLDAKAGTLTPDDGTVFVKL